VLGKRGKKKEERFFSIYQDQNIDIDKTIFKLQKFNPENLPILKILIQTKGNVFLKQNIKKTILI